MKSFNKNVSRLSFSLTWEDKDNHLVGGLTLKAFSNSANLVFLVSFSATEFWERLSVSSTEAKPMPRSQTTAFVFSQFTTCKGAVHYMGLPEQEYAGTQPQVSF